MLLCALWGHRRSIQTMIALLLLFFSYFHYCFFPKANIQAYLYNSFMGLFPFSCEFYMRRTCSGKHLREERHGTLSLPVFYAIVLLRVEGKHINSLPFLCSILKSGTIIRSLQMLISGELFTATGQIPFSVISFQTWRTW